MRAKLHLSKFISLEIKKCFIVGLLLFTLSSAGCAFSIGGYTHIVTRIIQGVSAAILGPQVIALIKILYPSERQGFDNKSVHLFVRIKQGIVCTEKDLNKTKNPIYQKYTGF